MQRGGNLGKGTEEKEMSYLLSEMKVFQRELVWMSEDAEQYITSTH